MAGKEGCAIEIQGTALIPKEYRGKRVVTFKDIDAVHKRPEGTASRNFKSNRYRFISGVDYYTINQKDVGTEFVQTYGFSGKAPSGLLITETGYLMLVKSFTDDRAWKMQRELVDSYFRSRVEPESNVAEMTVTETPVIEHEPEVYLDAARIMATIPDSKQYVINCLRHIVSDIDDLPAGQMTTEIKAEVTVARLPQKGNPQFYKVGVPCDIVKLKRTMNARKLSISKLALTAEISTATVKNLLDGKHRPTLETRTKICSALQVSEDYLTASNHGRGGSRCSITTTTPVSCR